MGGGLFTISWSKIATFERCRKQFWFRYVAGVAAPVDQATPAGLIGQAVHRGMRALCDTGEPEDGVHEMETYLRMPAHECGGPGTEGWRRAFEYFEHGVQAHESIDADMSRPELDTWVPVRDRGVNVLARIDRADRLRDGTWQVIDWKTGGGGLADQTDRQLDIGHLAVRTQFRLPREANVTAVAWNLQTGDRRVRSLTRDDGRRTVNYIVRIAQRMQAEIVAGDFPATPSRACSFCAWRGVCPDAEPDLSWLDAADDGEELFDPVALDGDDVLPFD